jgi:carboxypeptidase Taq
VPVDAQRAAVAGILLRLGVDGASWRVDVSAHPFTSWMGRRDTRLTTRYGDGDVESLLSSLHEYGHALYERQIDPALERTNLGRGTSMSVHESQSKLWENHVARSPAFAEVLAAELGLGGFPVSASELHATLVGVEPSLIRVSADPLTYPLHIILRFQLELALIEGELAVSDLPAAWGDGMRRLLDLDVPSDAQGCLQDIHWGAGSFGYFPSYALGCLIAAQLWEAMEAEIGPREEDLRRGEVAPIQRWLGERVHRHGRRLDTVPLVEHATGRGLEIDPFLRYVAPLAGRP